MKRYHPLLVTLHWLLAILVIGALIFGLFVLEETPNSDPAKIELLKMHMLAGISILVLMSIRLVVRLMTKHPPDADTGFPLLNKLVKPMHYLLYVAVIAQAGSGIATSKEAGLPAIVFDGIGKLPKDFHHVEAHEAHETIALVLMLLIAGHIAAAIYHHFIRKDGLLSRMWFGERE